MKETDAAPINSERLANINGCSVYKDANGRCFITDDKTGMIVYKTFDTLKEALEYARLHSFEEDPRNGGEDVCRRP